MKAEQNELVTRIGPGTPCGELMRRYWQPVALVDEFNPRLDPAMGVRPVKAVRLLGRTLCCSRTPTAALACWTATARTAGRTSRLAATRATACAAPSTAGSSTPPAAAPTPPPSPAPPPPALKLAVLRAEPISVPFYRYLYNTVGETWLWWDRRRMSDATLAAIIGDKAVEVYVLYVNGEPAGFIELDRRDEGTIAIAYFGLMPHFIGRGLGPWFLHLGIDVTWRYKPARLTVSTCTLDHPKALALYQRMGFEPVRQSKRQMVHPGHAP